MNFEELERCLELAVDAGAVSADALILGDARRRGSFLALASGLHDKVYKSGIGKEAVKIYEEGVILRTIKEISSPKEWEVGWQEWRSRMKRALGE